MSQKSRKQPVTNYKLFPVVYGTLLSLEEFTGKFTRYIFPYPMKLACLNIENIGPLSSFLMLAVLLRCYNKPNLGLMGE
jgi:hypothetical protein